MKIIFFFLGCMLGVSNIFCQNDIRGNWLGTLNVGTPLKLVFHFNRDAAGHLSATMDSPDQNANGIACSSVKLSGDSLYVEVGAVKGMYSAKLLNDTVMAGKWSQGPASLALTMKKVNVMVQTSKPQTPLPPFSYQVEEVEYDNPDKSVHFGATLTFPKSGGPFPFAVLITGSGQEDRDETIYGHKPFAVIADYLAKKGFGVLRVDDRGTGKTTGDVAKATSADYANDVKASLAYLKTRPEADKTKTGLIGHSEGGLIADMVAAGNKDIYFIIMLAGPGTTGKTLMLDQGEAVLLKQNVSDEAARASRVFYKNIVEAVLQSADTASAYSTAMKDFTVWKNATPDRLLNELGLTSKEVPAQYIRTLVNTYSIPWFRYFLNSDPAALIQQLSCKVLALNGEKDVQVVAAANLAGIKAALEKSGSKVYNTMELAGLNHLFQTCKTCSASEYGQLDETFSPVALKVIGDWLQKNVQH